MLTFILNLRIQNRTDEVCEFHPNPYRIDLDSENLDFDTIAVKNKIGKSFLGFEISEYNKQP